MILRTVIISGYSGAVHYVPRCVCLSVVNFCKQDLSETSIYSLHTTLTTVNFWCWSYRLRTNGPKLAIFMRVIYLAA